MELVRCVCAHYTRLTRAFQESEGVGRGGREGERASTTAKAHAAHGRPGLNIICVIGPLANIFAHFVSSRQLVAVSLHWRRGAGADSASRAHRCLCRCRQVEVVDEEEREHGLAARTRHGRHAGEEKN